MVQEFPHACGVVPDDIDHFVPHQANGNMLDSIFADLEMSRATMHRTLTHYANTGAASTPITPDAAARSGAFTPGDPVLLAGFGGGMSAGLVLVEW